MSARASSAGPRPRRSTECCTKYPPRPKQPSGRTYQQEDAGGMRVCFGRQRSLVFPPSLWQPKPDAAAKPSTSLRREYVYGYNGSCRNSLHFISETEIVYPLACLVVVLDVTSNTQRFFEGHTNDVKCLAWNETKQLCISGQDDVKGAQGPKACIWSTETLASLDLPHPGDSRSVCACALGPDGNIAVTFTSEDTKSFYIWRGNFSRLVGRSGPLTPMYSCSSGRQTTHGIFMLDAGCTSSMLTFSTVGESHFKHWVLDLEQRNVKVNQKKGVFGKCPAARNPTGWAWHDQDGTACLVGDNGHIFWVTNHSATAAKRLAPGTGGLGCVARLPDGRWIAGSMEGSIYIGSVFPFKLEEEFHFSQLRGQDVQAFCSTSSARFNSVSVSGHMAVFGAANHALFLVDYLRRELLRVLQVSHSAEAWALDFHPSLSIMATGSAKGGVRFWNVAERTPAVGKVLRSEQNLSLWSLAFRPTDGSLLALGYDKGLLEVVGFPSLQPTFRERLSRASERISALRFSEDGQFLAAGCWDQEVYLLRVDAEAKVYLYRVLSGNSSSITALQFSGDSRFVMSNSKDCQVLHWSTKDGSLQSSHSVFRDTRWQKPWTCVVGWPVIGLWSDPKYDASDINSACQSWAPSENLLAFGDDYGCLKLVRFPCPFVNPGIKSSSWCPQSELVLHWRQLLAAARPVVFGCFRINKHRFGQVWQLRRKGDLRPAEQELLVVALATWNQSHAPSPYEEFKTDQYHVSWVPGIFLLCKGAFTVPGGYALHRFGCKTCLRAGSLLILAASLVYPWAPSLWLLAALHGLYGAAYDLSGLGPVIVFATTWFDSHAALAIALLTTAFSVSGMVFPPLFAALIARFGWRHASLAIPVVMALVVVPLCFQARDGPLRRHSQLPSEEDGSTRNFRWSLSQGAVWHLAFLSLYLMYVVIALINSLVMYLKTDVGMALELCGLYSSAVFQASIAGKLVMGTLMDGRFQSVAGLVGCLVLLLGTLLPLDIASGGQALTSNRVQLLAFAIIYGFGFGACYSMICAKPAKMFGRLSDFSKLQGFFMLFQVIGGFLGTLITGKLRAISGDYLLSFYVFIVMAVLTLCHYLALEVPRWTRGGADLTATESESSTFESHTS
ncbi:unnamed protein product [Effrenium voratum]|nr:unnamed protein product [Effrenium voratum]